MIRLGYACINMELREKNIYTSRTVRKKTFDEKGLQYVSNLCLNNVLDLIKILKWNYENNIFVFRISSEMFPWASHYNIEDLPDYENIARALSIAGRYAQKTNQRLSFHPGQFNCLASSKEDVIKNSIVDLEIHAKLFDLMQLPKDHNSKINIHLGSSDNGNLISAANNFCNNFDKLSDSVKSRLTIENDDKASMFSAKFLYENVYKNIGTPIVFDAHHFELGPQDCSYEESFIMSYETWKNIRPTFHYSNSRKIYEDTSCRVYTAHSDYYYKPFNFIKGNIDLMLESKCKEKSLIKYINDFNIPEFI